MKKLFLLILIGALVVMPVYATISNDIESSGLIEPYFTNIYTFHTYFDIDGVGKASLVAVLDGHGADTSRIEGKLQRYSNDEWTTIKTFTSISSNADCSLEKTYYVEKGYSYRVLYYAFVYSGPILLDHTSQISPLQFY